MNTLKNIDKNYLINVVQNSSTLKEILVAIGLVPTYSSYKRLRHYLYLYGLNYSHLIQSKYAKVEFEEIALRKAVLDSETLRGVLTKMGISDHSANYRKLHKSLKQYNIDVSHFLNVSQYTKKMFQDGKLRKTPNENLFVSGSTISRNVVKNRIICDNIIPYVCQKCGRPPEWFGEKLVLILDHINGVNNDHRLSNLRFLCPNCESTVPTHCKGEKGLKIKKVENKRGKYFERVRTAYDASQQQYIPLILSYGIDFSKFGWASKVAEVIDQPVQKVNKWMKRFMPDVYSNQCFKRKTRA
jgi:hypothetical protein